MEEVWSAVHRSLLTRDHPNGDKHCASESESFVCQDADLDNFAFDYDFTN